MENDEIVIDLVNVAKALWKKAWAIVLAAVIFGGAMYAYKYYTYIPQYTAKAILYTKYQSNRDFASGENSGNISQNSLSDSRNLVKTCTSLLNTRMLQEEVIRKTDLNITPSQLAGMISAASINSTELFTITVTTDNAENAALIANAVAEILPEKVAMINESSHVGIIDRALVPTASNSSNIAKNTTVAAVLGAFLVCGVVATIEIITDWKEQSAKKKNS